MEMTPRFARAKSDLAKVWKWVTIQIPSGMDEPEVFKRKLMRSVNVVFLVIIFTYFLFVYFLPTNAGILDLGYSRMKDVYGPLWEDSFWREIITLAVFCTSSAVSLYLIQANKTPYFVSATITFLSITICIFISDEPVELVRRSFLIWALPIAFATLFLPPWTGFLVASVEAIVIHFLIAANINLLGVESYTYASAYTGIILLLIALIYWLQMTIADNAVRSLRQEVVESRRHAEDADRLRSRILGIVSHEMRTPINVIEMSAEAVLEGAFPAEKDRDVVLAQIADGAKQLGQLVEDLLDQTRLDSGALVLRPRPFRVKEALLAPVLERYRPRAEAGGLALSGGVAQDMPDMVMGDVNRLVQILGNLVENAVKFTRKGSVRVEVVREGETWGFDVTDTGIGIAEAELEEIWKSFRMVDDTRARLDQHGGLGLGLAIVSGLVAAMGGSRSVESRVGQGSTFRVRLPLVGPREAA